MSNQNNQAPFPVDGGRFDIRAACSRRNSSAIIHTDNGCYLLQLRDDKPSIRVPGHWACFGGSSEPGESAKQTLLRELDEELGFRPKMLEPFTELVYHLPQIGVGYTHRTFFEICVEESDLNGCVLNEGQAMEWFTFEEIKRLPKVVPWDFYGVQLHAMKNVSLAFDGPAEQVVPA